LVQVTDIIVLAKAAKEIAGTKKYSPGATVPHQGGLFTKMGIEAGDPGPPTGAAIPRLPVQPVHAALTGTKTAGLH